MNEFGKGGGDDFLGKPVASMEQRFAIKRIYECGPKLAEMHPEMVTDAFGLTAEELAVKYGVKEFFGVNTSIAKRIFARALKELMSSADLKARETHLQEKVRGQNKIAEKGIYGLTTEKLQRNAAMGGRASKGVTGNRTRSGSTTRDKGAGIFSYTPEKLKEISLEGHKDRDDSWVRVAVDGVDEGNFTLALSRNPDYSSTNW